MNVLIESPTGEQMIATEKAYKVIYNPLYNYKLIEVLEDEPIKEEIVKDQKKDKKAGRRPPKAGE